MQFLHSYIATLLKVKKQFNNLTIKQFYSGQSLIEILVAMGLVAILLPAILTGLVASREGKAQEGQRLQAAAMLKEAEEAIRSVREKGWANIAANGVYHPEITGSAWSLLQNPLDINDFTQQIEISSVNRDGSGNIVTGPGTLDPSTKKVVSKVSWRSPVASQVDSTMYLTRNVGNNTLAESAFNSGTHNHTIRVPVGDGAIQLDQSPGSQFQMGNKFLVDSTTAITPMINNFIATDISFTAQSSKTVDKIRVYLQEERNNSPIYRYGIKTTPSGPYLSSATYRATTTGWQTIDINPNITLTAGSTYHIFIEYASGTINGLNNISVMASLPQNKLYPYNGNTDTNANTGIFNKNTNVLTPQNEQPIYELQFAPPDNNIYEGNPYDSGSEFGVFAGSPQGEQFKVSSPTTVYDISWLVKRTSQPPQIPLSVTLIDIANAQSPLASGVLVQSNQITQNYTYYKYTFAQPIVLSSANTYRIYLSSTTPQNRRYMVKRVFHVNSADLNSINYDGTNSVFYSALGTTNFWDAAGWYFTASGTTGDYTSPTYDRGNQVAFNNITWSENLPNNNTNVQLQVSVDGGPFIGPNGAGTYFDTPPGGAIPLNSILGQTIRFKAFLTGNGSTTPTLNDVTINYSP